MSEKLAKTICRYAQTRGHKHLRLEKQGQYLVCACGHGQQADYLRLDSKTELSIKETFRRLSGVAENDLFANRRFKIVDGKRIISGRATLLPAPEGEKLLITLGAETPDIRRLSGLGLNRDQQLLIRQSLKRKSGLIIIASAPENGASSTYISLLTAAAAGRSAYSLEAYPHKNSDDINIIKLNPAHSVASVLDRLLHLDSELIGVDAPLRANDLKALMEAAASGRLVIATLPVENAAKAVKYLCQAGVSAKEIASQIIFIAAQKLFPRPCPRCLQKFDPGIETKAAIINRWPFIRRYWPSRLYRNDGCAACRQQPPTDKTAVFEIMRFWPDGRLRTDYRPLSREALAKASLGLINIEDIAAWAKTETKV